MHSDDALTDGESESECGGVAAGEDALGGDEGLEDAVEDFEGDAGPGVGDTHDGVAGIGGEGNGEATARGGHGFDGVGDEVEEDALHARGIERDGGELVVVADEDDGGGADAGFHDGEGVVEEGGEIAGTAGDVFLAGEGEEVGGDDTGLVHPADDGSEVASELEFVGGFEGFLGTGQDGPEEIVKLVGDACGHGPDDGFGVGGPA